MRQKILSNRSFGVELEVGSEWPQKLIADHMQLLAQDRAVIATPRWCESIENSYWHVKYDSTCGVTGPGWEIASFKASGWDDLCHIAEMAMTLKQFGLETNNNCGFHIHADASDFTPEQMGILLGRWMQIEPMLCKLVPSHRVNNRFCKLICKSRKIALSKPHTGLEIWEALKPTNFDPHENRQKKVTLNTVNYAGGIFYDGLQALGVSKTPFYKPKTIEFRLPEGTLDFSTIVAWTAFFLNFVDTAKESLGSKNLSGVRSVRKFFQIAGLDGDRDVQLDDILFTSKLWLLKRFYMFGGDDLRNQIGRLQFD